MNKERRILAARKMLKEFQRVKKDQIDRVPKEQTDPEKPNSDQNSLIEESPNQNNIQQLQQNLESNENNGIDDVQLSNMNTISDVISNVDSINNATVSNEDISSENICTDRESLNDSLKSQSFNNGAINYNTNDSSSCPISSQIIYKNIDENNAFQNLPQKQYEHSNVDTNIPCSSSNSSQKEHLLQMANAVANILVDETSLEDTTLTNYDLEQKNQFLACCLEEQKKVANQLHVQVSQYTSRISELEAIIHNKDTEFEARLIREVNPLKERVQLDAQTIGILVAEKAELIATNSQCQLAIKQKTEETIDVSGKLKLSQQQGFELERDLSSTKNSIENLTKACQQLQINNDELHQKLMKLTKENEDFELEISELRQKFNYKNTEFKNIQQELQEKCALLSLSELRIQQISSSPQEAHLLETQHQATKVLEQQLSQMKEALESLSKEKDEASKKYQNYVQQLDERHTKLMTELEASKKVIMDSEIREQSYVQRLSELEQQLQKEKAKLDKPNEIQNEKIDTLTKSVDNLVLEQENLQSLLNEKDNEIETLKKDLRELQDIKDHNVEASKLATALQSEQLGASRAVSQNQLLKTQLDEMNDAFIALSNTKLDLTERVQAERTISKKLNAQLNDLEKQVEELNEQLSRKEEALVEMRKEKLQTAQIEDQIQHYQAQSHSATTLQQELQKALITIENLKKENQVLHRKVDDLKDTNVTNVETYPDIGNVKIHDNVNISDSEEKLQAKESVDDIVKIQPPVVLPEDNAIASIPEPVKKLEIRFKETMEKIAELTDEKQRLEHLVLQLQGETETIGEYVTLYQKQRSILQEKAKEKENTFRQLLEQRNEQQEQLHKLKVLVSDLLKSEQLKSVGAAKPIMDEDNASICDNSAKSECKGAKAMDVVVDKLDGTSHQTDKTTSQILDLLTEIKDCNNTCFLEPNFHPCPWCSGKLITI